MKNTVDVIIPAYNSLPWLQETIASVLAQTHQDLKVYVVDDGSTDGTAAYIKTLDDKRVHYLKKENGGVSSARNLGIRESSSPFVTFLDADDIWYPHKLEKQLEIIASDPKIGLVYGYHYLVDDKDIILGNLRISRKGNLFDALCDGNCIAGSASMVLVRREILNSIGLFREDLVNGEDWEYWLRISRHTSIDFVPEIVASIRVHDKNAQANTKKMADGLIQTMSAILESYKLTKNQKVRVVSYCLSNAINSYLAIADYPSARRATRRLIKENPHSLIDGSTWRVTLGFSLIAKGIFTTSYGLFAIHVVKKLFKLPFRILRKVVRVMTSRKKR